mmetsp:Transcript_6277/g.15903  ORF Transcript_6277/g.15903 Transcript_6277/m.15903 type:complete len:278 (-) Transcript_6277:731-1564(-)
MGTSSTLLSPTKGASHHSFTRESAMNFVLEPASFPRGSSHAWLGGELADSIVASTFLPSWSGSSLSTTCARSLCVHTPSSSATALSLAEPSPCCFTGLTRNASLSSLHVRVRCIRPLAAFARLGPWDVSAAAARHRLPRGAPRPLRSICVPFCRHTFVCACVANDGDRNVWLETKHSAPRRAERTPARAAEHSTRAARDCDKALTQGRTKANAWRSRAPGGGARRLSLHTWLASSSSSANCAASRVGLVAARARVTTTSAIPSAPRRRHVTRGAACP